MHSKVFRVLFALKSHNITLLLPTFSGIKKKFNWASLEFLIKSEALKKLELLTKFFIFLLDRWRGLAPAYSSFSAWLRCWLAVARATESWLHHKATIKMKLASRSFSPPKQFLPHIQWPRPSLNLFSPLATQRNPESFLVRGKETWGIQMSPWMMRHMSPKFGLMDKRQLGIHSFLLHV